MRPNARGILGLLIWSQAMFVASTFRSWLVILALLALASVLTIARDWANEGNRFSAVAPRWLSGILSTLLFAIAVFVVTLWRIGSQVGTDINPVYLGADILAHSAMVVSLIIWVMCPRRGHLAMLPLGLIVVLLAVAAGGASVSLTAQTTVALAACLGFTIGSQIILGSEQSTRDLLLDRGGATERSAWLAPVFSLLALSVLMMGTSAIANATNSVLPTIQNRLQEQLKSSLDAVGEQTLIGGTRYVRGGRIGSIRRHMLANPREVALKVHCQFPPGYLRGSVFDVYRGGRWIDSGGIEFSPSRQFHRSRDRDILPVGAGSVGLPREIKQGLQRFPLVNQSPSQTINLEVHNDPMKGQMVFLPLSTFWLEAQSRQISVSHHGIVRLGVDVTRPYVAGVGTTLPSEQLIATHHPFAMDISPANLPVIKAIAERVCKSARSAPAKAAAIRNYFQGQYAYSLLSADPPRGTDPIIHFLETEHDAHCEYFASATTLMLRAVGVPARYVTGYVADEQSDQQSGLWLARNQDAHAWVEAFDNQNGRWFPVESTPGRSYRTVEPNQQAEVTDDMLSGLLESGDRENDTLLGQLIRWLATWRVTVALLALFRFTQLPLFLILVYVLWTRYLRPSRSLADPADWQSRRMLRQVDRRLRSYSLVRHPSETLYQFADRIDRFVSDRLISDGSLHRREAKREQLARAANWYRAFADARYQGQLPKAIQPGISFSRRFVLR